MSMHDVTLEGTHVRLEPLSCAHVEGFVAAASADPSLYRWSAVPVDTASTRRYVKTALRWRDEGTAVPFATVRKADGRVVGSTRFWNLEHWAWPEGHPRAGRTLPEACEIGHTWLGRDAIRTAANTEAKYLMLRHAFESWEILRVCLHTDMRNDRSRAAMERIGLRFEGILRAHRIASDLTVRDSARYSLVRADWPEVKERLERMLTAGGRTG